MNTYTVHIELFGKKFTIRNVRANNEEDAKYQIYGKIKFHQVKRDTGDIVNDIFSMFK